MKRPLRYNLTYTYTLLTDIIAWAIVFTVWVFWGTNLRWQEGLWCDLKPNRLKWWQRRIAGITLGHGGIYTHGLAGKSGIDTKLEFHEHVHVEQYEGAMLQAFIAAVWVAIIFLIGGHVTEGLVLGLAIWGTGWVGYIVTRSIQAWIRGEDPYSGATHEEAANALGEQWRKGQ